MSWSDFFCVLITFPLIAWIFFTWMKDKCFEKHKSPWNYLCKPWEAWVLLAFFQLFVLSLLFLSAVLWREFMCFCWTSVPLGTQADTKLQLQCFQVRAWISIWNSYVQLWGIQHEYCDSCYSTFQIKRRCLSWCCINILWHCTAPQSSKPAVPLSSAHKNMCSNELITVALQKEAISPCAFQKQFHLSYRKMTLRKNKVALFFFFFLRTTNYAEIHT